jgi:RNA polymerase sigma-70 factor (ECF subfamily)
MDTTSVSLIERLRNPDDSAAWTRFSEICTPLLFRWAKRMGLQDNDAADLVQEVYALLIVKLPEFRYDPTKSFRSWLRTVALNKWRETHRRRTEATLDETDGKFDEIESPPGSVAFWEVEYRDHLAGLALAAMQEHFEPNSWKACVETVVHGRSTADVAAELGMSEGAVYVAKFRVIRKLRQELAGMVD